jgi:hypothetical protein
MCSVWTCATVTDWFCITVVESVYCAVRTETLYKTKKIRRVTNTCEHSSHKTTIIVFCLNKLHFSAIVTSAITRLEYNYQRNLMMAEVTMAETCSLFKQNIIIAAL